jgi:SPP1 gp7 family putative phage head morphogenesis protein
MGLRCKHTHESRQPVEKADTRVDWEREQRIVDKLAPRVERLSMRWFKGVNDLISNEAIRIAVQTGDPAAMLASFENLPEPKPPLPGEQPTVSKTYAEAVALEEMVALAMMEDIIEAAMTNGDAAWAALPAMLPAGLAMVGAFNVENPYVAPAAQARVGWLIQEVRNGTNLGLREAVATVIEGAYNDAIGVRGAEKAIRGMVGLRPDQVNAVNKVGQRLMAQGMKGQALSARLARESAKRLKYRANMIARTEMARAVNQGRHDAWKVARDRGMFGGQEAFVEWVAGITDRTCGVCADLNGEVESLGDDFSPKDPALSASQLGVYGEFPPIHPLCRCNTVLHIGPVK